MMDAFDMELDRRASALMQHLARMEFLVACKYMLQRIKANTAEQRPVIPKGKFWLDFDDEQAYRERLYWKERMPSYYRNRHGRDSIEKGSFASWISVDEWGSIPSNSITHFFSSDVYPIKQKPQRSKRNWYTGPHWTKIDIAEDDLLSCDGVHLWMWCLLDGHSNRLAVDTYTQLRFQALMDSAKYQAMFPGFTGNQLRQLVFTFHTGGIYPEVTPDNLRKYTNRLRKKVEKSCDTV